MKKIITTVILSLVFLFTTTIPVIAKDKKDDRHYNNGRQNDNSYHQDNYHDHHHDNYNNNYNNRPRSHYDEGKRYSYAGHYKSWDEWQKFRSQNPHVNRHGKYFHNANGSLMFGFTDEDGSSFFFSIGK